MSGRPEKPIPSPEGTAAVLAVSPLPADPGAAGNAALVRVPVEKWRLRTVGECPHFATNGKVVEQ
jgi:hypothetical protein